MSACIVGIDRAILIRRRPFLKDDGCQSTTSSAANAVPSSRSSDLRSSWITCTARSARLPQSVFSRLSAWSSRALGSTLPTTESSLPRRRNPPSALRQTLLRTSVPAVLLQTPPTDQSLLTQNFSSPVLKTVSMNRTVPVWLSIATE